MRSLLAASALPLALLAGCGDSTDTKPVADTPAPSHSASSTPTATKQPSVDLRKAVQAYSDAYLTGKAVESHHLLSERCQGKYDLSTWTGMVTAARMAYGSALPIRTFDAKVTGDLARVTYTYDVSAINQDAELWVREDGAWHEDDC